MVAGMIRELSTLQNLLCGQGGKTERKKTFFYDQIGIISAAA